MDDLHRLLESHLSSMTKGEFTFTPQTQKVESSGKQCTAVLDRVQQAFPHLKDQGLPGHKVGFYRWLHCVACKQGKAEWGANFKTSPHKVRMLPLEQDGDLELVITLLYRAEWDGVPTADVKPRVITRSEGIIRIPDTWSSDKILIALQQLLATKRMVPYLVSKFGKVCPKIPQI